METIEKKSSGGIVYRDGKFLAIHVLEENEIIFPKGTIEQGETPEETAVREIEEETGYHTKIITPIGETSYEFDEDGNHYRKTVYQFLLELLDENETPAPNREDYEVFENLWLTEDEAFERLTHENSRNILKRALAVLVQK